MRDQSIMEWIAIAFPSGKDIKFTVRDVLERGLGFVIDPQDRVSDSTRPIATVAEEKRVQRRLRGLGIPPGAASDPAGTGNATASGCRSRWSPTTRRDAVRVPPFFTGFQNLVFTETTETGGPAARPGRRCLRTSRWNRWFLNLRKHDDGGRCLASVSVRLGKKRVFETLKTTDRGGPPMPNLPSDPTRPSPPTSQATRSPNISKSSRRSFRPITRRIGADHRHRQHQQLRPSGPVDLRPRCHRDRNRPGTAPVASRARCSRRPQRLAGSTLSWPFIADSTSARTRSGYRPRPSSTAS